MFSHDINSDLKTYEENFKIALNHQLRRNVENEILNPDTDFSCRPGVESASIPRIPQSIREIDAVSFHPAVVSIGPYYRDEPDLSAMDQAVKPLCLKRMLRRSPAITLENYLEHLQGLIVPARSCYDSVDYIENEDFLEMLLLDGCFIIEILLANQEEDDNSVLGSILTLSLVKIDMLLVENQLPYFVLDSLYKLLAGSECTSLFYQLAINFFDSLLPQNYDLPSAPSATGTNFYHLLHLFHTCLVPDAKCSNSPDVSNQQKLQESCYLINCATDLQVDFKRKERSFCQISFQHGILEVSPVQLNNNNRHFYRNLIAFEQSLFPNKLKRTPVTAYAILMDSLIRSTDDLHLLRRAGVVDFTMGRHEAAAFFANLCQDTCWDRTRVNFAELLEPVIKEVRGYCDKVSKRPTVVFVKFSLGLLKSIKLFLSRRMSYDDEKEGASAVEASELYKGTRRHKSLMVEEIVEEFQEKEAKPAMGEYSTRQRRRRSNTKLADTKTTASDSFNKTTTADRSSTTFPHPSVKKIKHLTPRKTVDFRTSNPWILYSNTKLAYDLMVRPDGRTFDRNLAELFDKKVPASMSPVNGVISFDQTLTSNLLARIYRPVPPKASDLRFLPTSTSPFPVIIFFHGGSFVHSSPGSAIYDSLCRSLVSLLGSSVVISLDFRRSPEHRCPAAYEDGWAALKWASSEPWLRCSPHLKPHIFLAGDSSGGNIAHNVALRGAESGIDICGNILLNPLFGGKKRTESERRLEGMYSPTIKDRDWYWKVFLPAGADRDHPACNPFGPNGIQLQGLKFPKTLLVVARLDVTRDWQLAYARGLKNAGQDVKLVYRQATAGFYLLPENIHYYEVMKEIKIFVTSNC